MFRVRSLLLIVAALVGGCSLVVEFDRSLLLDGGIDGGVDAGVDGAADSGDAGAVDGAASAN